MSRTAHYSIRVPATASLLYKGPYDWAFETEPQSYLNDRRMYFGRGKGLGGSSTINSMIYMRGAPYDYDHWASLGNPGWSYAEVLPYFKKLEHYERGASEYHGVDGPLNVADLRYVNPLTRAFIEAAVAVGYARNDDFNGAAQEGVGLFQVTQKGGRRHSAADAYLKPAAPPTQSHHDHRCPRHQAPARGEPGIWRDLPAERSTP